VLAVLSDGIYRGCLSHLVVLGLYASKFGDDPRVEWLSVIAKLDGPSNSDFFTAAELESAG